MPSRPNPAVRGEPRGIGTAGARDPLAREVRLLGALLGQVIVEQEGLDLLELVERVRRRTIALRRAEDPAERARLSAELDSLDLARTEALIRSFGLYFQLVNLAEERHRVRTLRRRERAARGGILDDSVAEALRRIWGAGRGLDEVRRARRPPGDRPGPDGPPDRGPTADAPRRAPPLQPARGAARRPAPDP